MPLDPKKYVSLDKAKKQEIHKACIIFNNYQVKFSKILKRAN